MEKRNTKFWLVMFMNICMAWSLYKLVDVTLYLHCSELFAIGKFIMHLMLHEFIYAMNIMLKN
jgi:hypothetical protein